MGLKTPEELQALAKAKAHKDSMNGSAAVSANDSTLRMDVFNSPGKVLFNGDAHGRRRVSTDRQALAKAKVRAAMIEKGELPDEAPPMRGMPSHEQYENKCIYQKLEYIVTHDGYLIYHPMYGIDKVKIDDEMKAELKIPADVEFLPEGPALYNNRSIIELYNPNPVNVSNDHLAVASPAPVNNGGVNLTEEQFNALMNKVEELESKVNAKESKPVKKWNGQVTQLLNKGLLNLEELEQRYLEMGQELSKSDIEDLILHDNG